MGSSGTRPLTFPSARASSSCHFQNLVDGAVRLFIFPQLGPREPRQTRRARGITGPEPRWERAGLPSGPARLGGHGEPGGVARRHWGG